MTIDQEIGIATAIGTFLAVVVAMIAIYSNNKNSNQQVRIGKLEEALEVIQILARNYGMFKILYSSVIEFQTGNNDNLKTYSQYYTILNQNISEDERRQIFMYTARLNVLANCYTKGALEKQILDYEDLIYAFAEFVFNGGSLQKEMHWKDGFPAFEDFYSILGDLKKAIISQIK